MEISWWKPTFSVHKKKWKPTFYVILKTGRLCVFRSEEDFKDWLKNPYHSVEEREFLIKLNVDFINDVKSPKVLAYRTTQLKHKKYENGMMYQFKLEKVMDYGPTLSQPLLLSSTLKSSLIWAASSTHSCYN